MRSLNDRLLGGLVLLFFVVTLAKLGGNVANRPL